MSRPPKIVIPGLNRGDGIAGGFLVGRQKGKGPAELLSLNALRRIGLATKAGATQSTSLAVSTANSLTVSLSTSISTILSASISSANSRIDSLSTAGGGGADDDIALSTSLSSVVSVNTTQSTSLSQISSSLSTTNSTNVTQSTSLSQISSSLSGAISSTTSLSGAVSTTFSDTPTTEQMNAAIAAATGSGGTIPDGIVAGCGVFYSGSGLTFNMSAGSFYLDNTLLTATAQSVTLAAADATNPRIDALYVDSSGVLGKITGTAAADPSQPPVDPTTQLYLTFVLVPALATTITGITNENIYLEGAEWTGTTSGSGFTLNSTNNPFAGTKDIEGTTVAAAAYVKLVRSSAMSFDGTGNLTLEIRSKASWNVKRWLTFQWYLAGVAKGAAVSLKSGTFGFDSSITSGYQLIVIPKTQFAVPSGTNVDELRIVDVGGSIGFYLDNIVLQNTGTSSGGGGTGGITQAQADARYLQLTVGSTSLSQISSSLSGAISSTTSLSTAVSTVVSGSISAANSRIDSLSTAVGTGGGGPDAGQSTSLSQISSSLSTTNSTNVTQSTSLSQISSSLSGAISSTTSLSTAVSTVDSNQSTSLSQISASLSSEISTDLSRITSLSTAISAGSGGGIISVVQYKSFIGGPPTLTLAAAPTAGNQLMILGTHWNGISAIATPWATIKNVAGVTNDGIVAAVKVVSPADIGSATITNPFTANSGGAGGMSLTVVEVAGAAPMVSLSFDSFQEITGTSQSLKVASGKNGSLVFGIAATNLANTAPSSITGATALTTVTGTTTSGSPRQITPFELDNQNAGTGITVTINYAGSCVMHGIAYTFIPN